ncbi:hypothetical protein [Rhodanobacter sp. UC4436_H3]
MTPRIATSLAWKLIDYRWLLLSAAVGALAILLATIVAVHKPGLDIFCFAAMGPLVFLPWGLFCACLWFGPHGKYRQPNPAAPGFVRVIGWIAAVFLGIYVVGSALLWPLAVAI